MAKQLQLRRGTTSQHSSFTGLVGEVTVDTDKDTAVVHDGSTAGGVPLATAAIATNSSITTLGTVTSGTLGAGSILNGTRLTDLKSSDGSVTAMTTTTAGVVQRPVIPLARAYLGVEFTVTTSTVKVPMVQEKADLLNNFSTVDSRFTCPVQGVYLISFGGTTHFPTTELYCTIFLKLNGSTIETQRWRASAIGTNSQYFGGSCTTVIEFAASDYLELWSYGGNGTAGLSSGEWEFNIVFLG